MSFDAFYRKRKALSQYLPPSERHKLKVERPRSAPVNSPLRQVIEKGESESSPLTSANNTNSGKRRPSDPDSESGADVSNDGSRMEWNGEAQPPMKRSNTVNGSNGNGSATSPVTNGNNGVVETSTSMTTSWTMIYKNKQNTIQERTTTTKKVHLKNHFWQLQCQLHTGTNRDFWSKNSFFEKQDFF